MLVLTRKQGQKVVIGDPRNPFGTVEISSVSGDRVRLAFSFGKSIPVHREEVAAIVREEAKLPGRNLEPRA